VTEEEVFKESNGGHGHQTAYWVVYVNEELANENTQHNLFSYNPNDGQNIDQNHVYAGIIPGPINLQVTEDNVKLQQEILEY